MYHINCVVVLFCNVGAMPHCFSVMNFLITLLLLNIPISMVTKQCYILFHCVAG